MLTLGINAAYHDSAACLVKDGWVIAAAEEERFTRKKHGKRPIPFSTYELPFFAIDYCLREAGVHLSQVDHIAYSFDPYQLLGQHGTEERISLPLEPSANPTPAEWESAWDPLFLSSIVNAPRHLVGGFPHHIQQRFSGTSLNGSPRWHFIDHHQSHAASAFLPSPFSEAAILTLDGRGENATTTYSYGSGTKIERIGQVNMPHSLGILYERVTEHLGFLHSADEYKVMALASFGKPVYHKIFQEIIQVGENGVYNIQPIDLIEQFGPARRKGEAFEDRHCDLAASLQVILEDTVLELLKWLHAVTGSDNLTMAGGVALNCVMNARLRDRGPFKNIWIQPAAGDAGTALGAAMLVDSTQRPDAERVYCMDHAFLGPQYSEQEIEEFLLWSKLPYRRLDDVPRQTAELLTQDKIIGWFQGRLEFGPRALGARSILASPVKADMQERLNDIKDREDFRPVAPVVLEEEAAHWFVNGSSSPFMLFVYDVQPDRAEQIPAVRHVDGTARIQTINREQNPPYYDLLKAFYEKTGVPVLVNTSFNTRGEPIVCTPRDAVECFWTSPLDALVIGPFLLGKMDMRNV
ncbi:MAG TPA: carbamoyltransferase C-terminal domain-containing protein [Anaerolineaceae bacterium]|nr:carbamoyltransferase C-terminal domain-containing protein [Anaerolineaceae bacterium]